MTGLGLLVGTLASTTVAVARPAPPASGRPGGRPTSIAGVQRKLGALALRNTQLVERYDQARVLVHRRQRAAALAQAAAARAHAALQRADSTFTTMVQAQYEAGQLSSAGALLDSGSGRNYLARLSTLTMLSNHNADLVALVDHARRIADAKSAAAGRLLAAATEERDALAAQRSRVSSRMADYRKLLAVLTMRQQAAYLHEVSPSVSLATLRSLPGAPSPAARKAVRFALAQVGKPYVFGASGPSSYDCSGLTMMAWRAAGVSLPHSAADQYNYGHHVAESHLRPGDLVFFYHPIGHVTIYIGDGLLVSAPTEGMPVQVVPLDYFQSDYAGATRLG